MINTTAMETDNTAVKIGDVPEALEKLPTEDEAAAQRALAEFQALTLGKKELSMTELYELRQYAKKRTDLIKPADELGADEAIWKAIYGTTEDLIAKNISPEDKAKFDGYQDQMDSLSKLSDLLKKLVPLGQEIETELTMQSAALVVYFDKGPENQYKSVVDGITTDLVNPDKWTPSERIEKAKTVLKIIEANREFLYKIQLVERHEKVHSKLKEFEKDLKQIDQLAQDKKVIEEPSIMTMIDNSKEWLRLTKDLFTSRTSAVSAVKNSLETDEFLPKLVLEKNGDVGDKIQTANPFFEQMIASAVLVNKASEDENVIGEKRNPISEVLFGKSESYMNLGKNDGEQTAPSPASVQKATGGMRTRTKWFIVIALAVVALNGGIWTAVGVFVLGAIMVGVLAK